MLNYLHFINVLLNEQRLAHMWKLAAVTPLPKKKQVEDLKKDLRLISLAACLLKVAVLCVIL